MVLWISAGRRSLKGGTGFAESLIDAVGQELSGKVASRRHLQISSTLGYLDDMNAQDSILSA